MVTLTTARLVVRTPLPEDAPRLLDFEVRNAAHFAPTSPPRLPGWDSLPFWERYVANAEQELLGDRAVRFVALRDQELVAVANFTQIFRGPFHACSLGFRIAPAHEGQGLMRETLQAAIAWMFHERNLHRIQANHLPDNERSARLLQRLGFVREGYARDYLFIAGRWQDHVLNALTNPAWLEP